MNLDHPSPQTRQGGGLRIQISGGRGMEQDAALLLIAHCLNQAGFRTHCLEDGLPMDLPPEFVKRWGEDLLARSATNTLVTLSIHDNGAAR
ncbi:hypothetical protein [Metapseudomonas furukawaii]|jgi:hypothetical protein|uniref:Uncharacterized protein n=1 Tax=Metapseudomonas furukawaii TaxID=1149133 RepID=A0AAD1FFI3_METFU|nr:MULTISPECIES: hypothetical protein [Pseudomonas]ELS26675.1 hypothetical protein ppKF707_3093 [Pseudomonas furukawaii]OWJ92711.1 hypothetical protein B6S59_19285 [Pseudomonas sp. A46]BAU74366.1 hypothetical protein KF707C_26780 [Pseudomonas furukawaii]